MFCSLSVIPDLGVPEDGARVSLPPSNMAPVGRCLEGTTPKTPEPSGTGSLRGFWPQLFESAHRLRDGFSSWARNVPKEPRGQAM